ncbi:MBL fold metallo-hydrolase [Sphingobium sp. SCG-1]|uniref:MBL fold metallo-hydrolase n=1 Tax=Sphingobium sp. SCG-1 TaxID=2072936 RepID=UPI000CD6AB2D|nr:MBL fold metallo-hydrolase [Sphingobium sp. SCG-1]AUW59291.1 MBL fold metallo-hydrolase [Sphingobium sp. SCG-1]
MKSVALFLASAALASLPAPAFAQIAPARDVTFTTLGTNSGPIPDPTRGEPSNLLNAGGKLILIDAGDGVADQLGKVGVILGDVETVLISHLHFDHTGGLFAFLGQRYQTMSPKPVTIYGPPGTRRTVEGLMAGMGPMTDPGTNVRDRSPLAPKNAMKVIELADREQIKLGDVIVTVANNSHYDNAMGAGHNRETASYSYRFDVLGRSIVYTGDTGPSARVEELAKGADLLIAEVMDPEEAVASLHKRRPDLPAAALAQVERHHRQQHLSPREVGLMAQRAGVRSLILTHVGMSDSGIKPALREIRSVYRGPVTFARDRQQFR